MIAVVVGSLVLVVLPLLLWQVRPALPTCLHAPAYSLTAAGGLAGASLLTYLVPYSLDPLLIQSLSCLWSYISPLRAFTYLLTYTLRAYLLAYLQLRRRAAAAGTSTAGKASGVTSVPVETGVAVSLKGDTGKPKPVTAAIKVSSKGVSV